MYYMAISTSNKTFYATALVFSGRKNPSWEIRTDVVEKAMTVFQNAPVAADHSPAASLLGYNGLQLEQGDKMWHAIQGRIFYKIKDEMVIVKEDRDRLFEQLLLQTAPQDITSLLDEMKE